MSKITSKSINIYLSLDRHALASYFNSHDTSPIYKRQLSVRLQQYIKQAVKSCKRYDPIFFKLNSNNRVDDQYAEPLMYAIRRHYTGKRDEEIQAFAKFKRRNYGTIIVSLVIVAILNLVIPFAISKHVAKDSGLTHFIDVFSFVIFYHPLTELLFNWNPYLKRINLLNKLINAEVILVGGGSTRSKDDAYFEDYEYMEEYDSAIV